MWTHTLTHTCKHTCTGAHTHLPKCTNTHIDTPLPGPGVPVSHPVTHPSPPPRLGKGEGEEVSQSQTWESDFGYARQGTARVRPGAWSQGVPPGKPSKSASQQVLPSRTSPQNVQNVQLHTHTHTHTHTHSVRRTRPQPPASQWLLGVRAIPTITHSPQPTPPSVTILTHPGPTSLSREACRQGRESPRPGWVAEAWTTLVWRILLSAAPSSGPKASWVTGSGVRWAGRMWGLGATQRLPRPRHPLETWGHLSFPIWVISCHHWLFWGSIFPQLRKAVGEEGRLCVGGGGSWGGQGVGLGGTLGRWTLLFPAPPLTAGAPSLAQHYHHMWDRPLGWTLDSPLPPTLGGLEAGERCLSRGEAGVGGGIAPVWELLTREAQLLPRPQTGGHGAGLGGGWCSDGPHAPAFRLD